MLFKFEQRKGAMTVGDLLPFVGIIVAVAIFGGIGADILDDIKDDVSTGDPQDAVLNGSKAITNVMKRLGTLGTIGVVAVILALLLAVVAIFRR